jgi:hypothetical protein
LEIRIDHHGGVDETVNQALQFLASDSQPVQRACAVRARSFSGHNYSGVAKLK